jgi:glycine cleavage system H protein
MDAPESYRFAKTHEWIREDDGIGYVGISDHAQDELGDIVFVELPEVGMEVAAGAEVTTIESVKAAGQIYAPVSGVVESVNEALDDNPEAINESPYEAFIFSIKLSDTGEMDKLLTEEEYLASLEE